MGFFDTEEGVDQYAQLADGYDGRELVEKLRTMLPDGATVLELGMGLGKDLDMLAEAYSVTGSDMSQVFLDRYRANNPEADLLKLDAVTVETQRTFDAIYSNKVLQHLPRADMARSLARQLDVLNSGGLAMHALWYGDKEGEHAGLLFIHYTEASIREALPDGFEVVEQTRYTEMADDDSLLLVLRKR